MVQYCWFHIKVLGVYTHSMETIYLSLSAQVAVGTFFMKSPVHLYLTYYLHVSRIYNDNKIYFSSSLVITLKTNDLLDLVHTQIRCMTLLWRVYEWLWMCVCVCVCVCECVSVCNLVWWFDLDLYSPLWLPLVSPT